MATIVEPGADLTDREIEVIRLMGMGLTNAKIAGQLHISLRTVDTHLQNARAKTGTTNRTRLLLWFWGEDQ